MDHKHVTLRHLILAWLAEQFSRYCHGHGRYFPRKTPCPYCGKRIRADQIGQSLVNNGVPNKEQP